MINGAPGLVVISGGTVSVKLNNKTGPYFVSHKGVRQVIPSLPYSLTLLLIV